MRAQAENGDGAIAAATTMSGAGARGTNRSNATNPAMLAKASAIVTGDACGRPPINDATL